MSAGTSSSTLPSEVWHQIFDLASDGDVLFQFAPPSAMAESAWFKTVLGVWMLRSPEEALNLVQRRSYTVKKAITQTCREWRRLGAEFLYKCIFLDDLRRLQKLCAVLDNESSLGWWTRRIHITRYTTAHLDDLSLISIIRHCPNLEIFIVDWPIRSSFGAIADSLTTYAWKTLRSIHWHVPHESLPKVIWALDSLPLIISANIDFEPPTGEVEVSLNAGAAGGITLNLRCLQQLSLSGCFQLFLEEASGWSIPALRSFSYDTGNTMNDQPNLTEFLKPHGGRLIFLDLNSLSPQKVATILDLCPELEMFAFNLDWRLPRPEDPNLEEDDLLHCRTYPPDASILVHRPHPRVTHIGLHGLHHAFGVGLSSTSLIGHSLVTGRINEFNFTALNKDNFPKLKVVRVLSRGVLRDLEKNDGPEDRCRARFDKWWAGCARAGVRLEDCTGGELGVLPEDSEDEESSSREEGSDEEGSEYEEEVSWESEIGEVRIERDENGFVGFKFVLPPRSEPQTELGQLLEECRLMNAERDTNLLAVPLDWESDPE